MEVPNDKALAAANNTQDLPSCTDQKWNAERRKDGVKNPQP